MAQHTVEPGRRYDQLRGRRALLFDFDGTLIHQTIDFDEMRRLVEGVFRQHGVSPDPWKGMFVLEMIERAVALLEGDDAERARSIRDQAAQAIVDLELRAAEGALAYAGVPEMLQSLRAAGLGVAIVTRNCRLAVESVMARNALACDVLMTRDDVAYVKPDPRHLLVALKHLGASVAQAVMVGDHPSDVLVGQRAGTATVGVLTPGAGPERFAEVDPDLVVSDVTELIRYL